MKMGCNRTETFPLRQFFHVQSREAPISICTLSSREPPRRFKEHLGCWRYDGIRIGIERRFDHTKIENN